MRHVPLVAALAATALSPSSFAGGTVSFDASKLHAWPSSMSSGDFEDVILGRFGTQGVTDAIVLRGGTPVMMFHPTGYDAAFLPITSQSGWTAMATLPGAGSAGQDAIAFANASGLWQGEFNESTGGLTTVQLASTGWENAARVMLEEVDGQPGRDIVVLTEDTKEVLTLVYSQSGWSTGPSLTFSVTTSDIVVGNFDRVAGTEVCVVHPSKIKLFDWQQNLLRSVTHPGGGNVLGVVDRQDGYSGKMVAVAWETATAGEWELFLMDQFLTEVPIALEFPVDSGGQTPVTIEPTAMSVVNFDFDYDSDEDLLIRHSSFASLLGIPVEYHTEDSSGCDCSRHLSTADPARWEMSGTVGNPVEDHGGRQGLGRLSSNTRAGIVVALDQGDSVYVEQAIEEGVGNSMGVDGLNPSVSDPTLRLDTSGSPAVWYLDLKVTLPSDFYSEGFDSMQVITWLQSNPSSTVNQTADSNLVFPIPPEGNPPEFNYVLPIPLTEALGSWSSNLHAHLQMQPVDTEPSGLGGTVIVDAGAAHHSGHTCSMVGADWDEYLDDYPSKLGSTVYLDDPTNPSGLTVGAYVSYGKLPQFTTLPPNPGSFTVVTGTLQPWGE